jgi:heme exporter protein C
VKRPPTRPIDHAFYALVVLTACVFVGEILYVFLKVPIEARMGIVQKIFYFHVPAAYAMYVGAGVCFVGSVGYLANPREELDATARAGAEAAVVFGMMVLVSGPLWAAKAWGALWTWDPRLTTELLSVLIYVAYLVLRGFAGDGEGERRFSAALGVLGAANLPIIHYSVQKWGGQHPTVISNGGGRAAAPRDEARSRNGVSGVHPPRGPPHLGKGACGARPVALAACRGRRHRPRARYEDRSMTMDGKDQEGPHQTTGPAGEGPHQTTGPEGRSTSFQAVQGEPEHYSGTTLLVSAYAAIWVILLVWVALAWRRQSALNARLDNLERVIDGAAAAPPRGGPQEESAKMRERAAKGEPGGEKQQAG